MSLTGGPHRPPYAGLPGLFDADPVDVAGRAFPLVFGRCTLVSPTVDPSHLDQSVAALAGIPFGTGFLGLIGRGEWERIQPIVMEVILLWEQALVAGQRTIGSDHARHYLVLLRRGSAMLQVPDPVGFLRNALDGGAPLR